MKRALVLTVLSAASAVFLVLPTRPAPAATVTYDVKQTKGVSTTFNGQRFTFTGTGTMTIDDVAGTVSFSITLSNQLTFAGTGQAAVTAKGKIFGLIDLSSGGINGSAIIQGAANKDRSKFNASIVAAIPNRLGPAPQGFVVSKMKIAGTRQP